MSEECLDEWVNEWKSEWVNAWMSECVNAWMSDWICHKEYVIFSNEIWIQYDWICHTIYVTVNYWVTKCLKNAWVDERISEWVNEWMIWLMN